MPSIKNNVHCQLLIPGLFFPDSVPQQFDPCRDLKLPALQMLLARSQHQHAPAQSMESWLLRAFGVTPQHDEPVASLTLLADAGAPQQHFWLRADPVHLQVERDQLILADSGTFPVSHAEAHSLTETLNRHFAGQGMIFYAMRPNRWYLRLEQACAIRTRPLPEVAGKNINDHLPCGENSMDWHALLNEIQMLFHEHPVNQQREQNGDMLINSVWLWGGGTLPQNLNRPFIQVWANDALAQGLALASGCGFAALPHSAGDWLQQDKPEGAHLIVLNNLRGAAQYGDIHGWREGLTELEQSWFAPLRQALAQGAINRLSLHATAAKSTHRFDLTRSDLWKFWRRGKNLTGYVK